MDPEKGEFDDSEQAKDVGEGASHSPEDVEDNRNRKMEKKLDHGLKETFPASDPVSINPGSD